LAKRGDIYYLERYKQLIDYSAIRYGYITPTDIDGAIEYKDNCWVFYEFKHKSAPKMSEGQRLAFERLTKDIQKPSLYLFAYHDKPPQEKINASGLPVVCYLFNGEWGIPKKPISVKEATDKFLEKWSDYGRRTEKHTTTG
jgi:hypothetical protein